jgi:hypothetical protein
MHQIVLPQPPSQAHSGADVGGQLRLEKGTHLRTKSRFCGPVIQIHAIFSMPSLWHPQRRLAVLSATTY